MRFKALTSFSGQISMVKDEIKEIIDETLIEDLTRAGYIVEENEDLSPTKKARKKRDE